MILALLFILSPLVLEPEGMALRQVWTVSSPLDIKGTVSPDGVDVGPAMSWERLSI